MTLADAKWYSGKKIVMVSAWAKNIAFVSHFNCKLISPRVM